MVTIATETGQLAQLMHIVRQRGGYHSNRDGTTSTVGANCKRRGSYHNREQQLAPLVREGKSYHSNRDRSTIKVGTHSMGTRQFQQKWDHSNRYRTTNTVSAHSKGKRELP